MCVCVCRQAPRLPSAVVDGDVGGMSRPTMAGAVTLYSTRPGGWIGKAAGSDMPGPAACTTSSSSRGGGRRRVTSAHDGHVGAAPAAAVAAAAAVVLVHGLAEHAPIAQQEEQLHLPPSIHSWTNSERSRDRLVGWHEW